ncbi:MAG TPA: decaprenyl-phosphate phosphoribosyltransferase [Candidatus Obscuribacterales bacterium]
MKGSVTKDSPATIPSGGKGLLLESSDAKTQAQVAVDGAERLRATIKLIRPKQWTKNLIAFAPALFSTRIHEMPVIVDVSLCVVAFCLVSSAVYIVNDVLDAKSDRLHPRKQNRPIASGRIGIPFAVMLAAMFAASGLALAFAVRPTLALLILGYFGLMMLYGTALKHMVLLDVFAIAAGFVLRAVGGAVAAGVPSSGWFLACTSFGALFLGLEKRRQELALLKDDASSHRKTLMTYSYALLDRMEAIIIPSLLTCYAFYSFQSYHGQWMMLTLPFVLYGVMRYQILSVDGGTTGSPEEVLFRDRPIQITILLWLLVCAGVVYDVIPHAFAWMVSSVDALRVR